MADITGKELNISQARSLENQRVGKYSKPARNAPRMIQIKNCVKGKLNWYSALEAISVAGLAGFLFFAGPKTLESIKYNQAKNQAIEQYGDINHDGFVSAEENKELFQNIFYKTGIAFNSETGDAKYSDGRQVPVNELTKIIRNYIEHPFPGR